jgi:hypothetical protein
MTAQRAQVEVALRPDHRKQVEQRFLQDCKFVQKLDACLLSRLANSAAVGPLSLVDFVSQNYFGRSFTCPACRKFLRPQGKVIDMADSACDRCGEQSTVTRDRGQWKWKGWCLACHRSFSPSNAPYDAESAREEATVACSCGGKWTLTRPVAPSRPHPCPKCKEERLVSLTWMHSHGKPADDSYGYYSLTYCTRCREINLTSSPTDSLKRDLVGRSAEAYGKYTTIAVLLCSGLICAAFAYIYFAGMVSEKGLSLCVLGWAVGSGVLGWTWPNVTYASWGKAFTFWYERKLIRGLLVSVVAVGVTSVLLVGALCAKMSGKVARIWLTG